MKTIWKYDIEIADSFTLDMPCNSKMLAVQEQHGKIVMWCEVDTEHPKIPHRMFVVGTGHKVPGDATQYLGTFQIPNFQSFDDPGEHIPLFSDDSIAVRSSPPLTSVYGVAMLDISPLSSSSLIYGATGLLPSIPPVLPVSPGNPSAVPQPADDTHNTIPTNVRFMGHGL